MCFYVLCIWMCPPKVEKFYEPQVASRSLVTIFLLLFIGSCHPAVCLLCLLYRNSESISPPPQLSLSLISYCMIKNVFLGKSLLEYMHRCFDTAYSSCLAQMWPFKKVTCRKGALQHMGRRGLHGSNPCGSFL